MKSIIASAILFTSSAAIAHDSSFPTDSCGIDLNAGVTINQDALAFTKNEKVLYKIVADKHLFVDGEAINLNASQQQLITQYALDVRAIVPEVKGIALEAIGLASEGVTLALNGLLGEGNGVGAELADHLNNLKHEIDNELDLSKEISIDEHGNFGDGTFGEDFEQRIEEVVESTVKNSMGTLLIAVGQEMLFSGGDTDAFEAKMESFGDQIELQMEERGKEIEQKGEALCHSVMAIDTLEEAMKAEIPALKGIDVLRLNKAIAKHSM